MLTHARVSDLALRSKQEHPQRRLSQLSQLSHIAGTILLCGRAPELTLREWDNRDNWVNWGSTAGLGAIRGASADLPMGQ
jgi:hypothetical protein